MSRAANRTKIAATAMVLALSACTTATPYRPAPDTGPMATGYTDEQIETRRFRVSFTGNSMTSREQVERYLLYRAAELTREQGYDWFTMVERNTDRKSDAYLRGAPFAPGPYGYWGPSWTYWGIGGPRYWDPYWGDPFWGQTVDIRTVDRYQASAEIVMASGAKPIDDPKAFDAGEVIRNLQDQIRRPPV